MEPKSDMMLLDRLVNEVALHFLGTAEEVLKPNIFLTSKDDRPGMKGWTSRVETFGVTIFDAPRDQVSFEVDLPALERAPTSESPFFDYVRERILIATRVFTSRPNLHSGERRHGDWEY